jgi:hypothetical protein
MRKWLNILLLGLMAVSLPLRSTAIAINSLCPAEEISASQSQASFDEDVGCCVAHCGSGSFVGSSVLVPMLAQFVESGIAHAERSAPAFIPDHLDPPPLADLR